MNTTKSYFKYLITLLAITSLMHLSCTEDFPENVDSPDKVVLKSIKITNTGADGNIVLEGTIDENKKSIKFPRIDPETDFSKLRFEASLSTGASLEKDIYEVSFSESKSPKTIILKVVNNNRFREYFAQLRLNTPVFGADFAKATVYDYTNNEQGNPIYHTFASYLTRGSGFDGNHVLIVTRHKDKSHLLKAEDLRKNKIDPIPLNYEGVGGGTFPVNCGAIVHGHTYIANLSGSQASPFRIYHWENPNSPAQKICDLKIASIPDAGKRHGDNMSVNIDENGNGFMYFGDNASTKILRLKVENFTTISDPKVLPSLKEATYCMSFNRVSNTSDYLFTGYYAPIMVANESAAISYKLPKGAIPLRASDARIINFNKERYLITTTAARTGSDAVVLYVYDLTKGDNTVDALKYFNDNTEKKPIYKYSLLGPTNIVPSTRVAWSVKKDDKGNDETLTIYTASNNAGFVIIDFPIKKLEDD